MDFALSSGLIGTRDVAGTRIALDEGGFVWAVITANNGGGCYSWQRAICTPYGEFTIDPFYFAGNASNGPAFETTGNTSVPIGAIVQLYYGCYGGNSPLGGTAYDWRFFYPNSGGFDPSANATSNSTNFYAKLTALNSSGTVLLYSWLQQIPLEAPGQWANGSLSGSYNAKEFNNNNVTIGTYVHLFRAYYSGDPSVAIFPIQLGSESDYTIQGANVTATGGTFTLIFNDGNTTATTGGISFNASTADVESALEALPNIVNCTVTGSVGTYTIEFNDELANFPLMQYDNYLTATTEYVFNLDTGNAATPGSITTNCLTVNNQTFLNGENVTINAGNLTIYGNATFFSTVTISILNVLQIAVQNITVQNITVQNLTVNNQTQQGFWAHIQASNGTPPIYAWEESYPTAPNTWIDGVGRTGTFRSMPGWERNGFLVPYDAHVWMMFAKSVAGSVVIAGAATDWTLYIQANSGFFTLSVTVGGITDTTGLLDWDIDAADLKTALEALSTVGAGGVTVTGGGHIGNPFVIDFVTAVDADGFVADDDGLGEYASVLFDYETPPAAVSGYNGTVLALNNVTCNVNGTVTGNGSCLTFNNGTLSTVT